MNIKYIYQLLVIFYGFVLPISSLGQNSFPAEKVSLMTDRELYICGESISFSGMVSLNKEKNILSEAAYIELISPSGQKINQSKVKIINKTFNGQLIIPADALSGYYFIRAYTKWMRNGPVSDYSYVLLKLVNAYSQDLNEINDSLVEEGLFNTNKLELSQDILLNKTHYQASEKVTIDFEKILNLPFTIAEISVFPLVAKTTYLQANNIKASFYDSIYFYPETRGLTISGKVMDNEGLLPFHKVNLHLKDEKDFISVLSDSSGHFYIALPERTGSNELFVIASTQGKEMISVLIDQDFCTRPINLKVPPFSFADMDRDQLLIMAQTLQLNDLFYEKDTLLMEETLSNFPFYGKAYKSIVFDSYIELDSLSQYFTDLPSWVNVKKEKGKRKLFISGTEAEMGFIKPLVLIDYVPIDDIESILKIDPRRIESFDVIIKPYIHGGIIYGGIIALFSRKSDFGGFTFPESAMYINYNFYSPSKDLISHSNDSAIEFYNTSVWIPSISRETLHRDLDFYMPAIKGKYVFQFQYINEFGEKKLSQNILTID